MRAFCFGETMPNMKDFDNQDDWMKACVPRMMEEGKDNEQAVAACMGMWKDKEDAGKLRLMTSAVKAGDDYTLEILGVPFGGPLGGRDRQGERFTAETNLHLDKFKTIPLVYAHGRDPKTAKPIDIPIYVGTAEYLRTDERGHWFKGMLDKTKDIVHELWKSAKKSMLGASSGSINYLTRVSRDGTILEWPVAELTLVETDQNLRPVNSYAVALPMMKAIYEQAGLILPDISENDEQGAGKAAKIAKKNLQKRARYLSTLWNDEE
jgi:hypothetical protein